MEQSDITFFVGEEEVRLAFEALEAGVGDGGVDIVAMAVGDLEVFHADRFVEAFGDDDVVRVDALGALELSALELVLVELRAFERLVDRVAIVVTVVLEDKREAGETLVATMSRFEEIAVHDISEVAAVGFSVVARAAVFTQGDRAVLVVLVLDTVLDILGGADSVH